MCLLKSDPMGGTNPLSHRSPAKLGAWRVVLLASLCALLAGCYDTKQEITLNPDGSGKIVIESVFQQITPFLNNQAERAALNNVTNVVQSLIEKSEGVEAWRDITFQQREDGKAFFRGTAYFRSLTKLKIAPAGEQRFSATTDPSGTLTISMLNTPPPDNPISKPDEPVTRESIQRERAQFRALLPALQTTIGEMRQDTTIHIPGTLLRASVFETNTPRTLRLLLDGRKQLAALEARAFDTSLDARRIAGEKFGPNDGEMMRRIYGHPGPIVAVIKPGQAPLFDFEKEVAAARVDFASTAKLFGLAEKAPILLKPAVDGAPAKVKVTGIQWKFEKDSPDWSPDNEPQSSYVVSLNAELTGTAFTANRVELVRAVTREGAVLSAQNPRWNDTPRLWPGATNVTFAVRLSPPPRDSQGIAELSGVLECTSPENVRTVELVAGKIRSGVKGTEFNTQIDDVYPNMASEGDKLALRTSLKPEQLRSTRIVGDAGQVTILQLRSHTILGNDHIYTFASRNELPRTGKLLAEVITGTQTLRIPFALTNVTLLGQPQ